MKEAGTKTGTSEDELRRNAHKGRGATVNPSGRFESFRHADFDDGWAQSEVDVESLDKVKTLVIPEQTRSIVSTNQSPDIPFGQSLNPYKGCEHGCVYCFARPTHSYIGLSPGLDFETKIFSKPQGPTALRKRLRSRNYRCKVMALGSNTDAYQPIERKLGITRQILEVLAEHQHPVMILSKSTGILRDLDILRDMAKLNLVGVLISVTTLDAKLASIMEPRAASPASRLRTMSTLARAGIPVGCLMSPMVPAINDTELEAIAEAVAKAGAISASYLILRLPFELKDIFISWLDEHFSERKQRVLSRLKELHGGNLYRSDFGVRMRGTGAFAALLRQRYDLAIKQNGLKARLPDLASEHFCVPKKQLSLPLC